MRQDASPRTATELKGKAFIAMPFHKEFEAVHAAINNGVLKAGFAPYRSDLDPRQPDWLEGIYQNVWTAAVFIAVCTPETRTGVPNPNVMFELGFARGLEMPEIIVTNDARKLPADLRTRSVLEYSKRGLTAFEDRLCASILARAPEPGRKVAGLDPLLARSFQILSFVKELHHAFQILNTLEDLLQVLEESLTQTSPDGSNQHERPCRRAWDQYELQYNMIREEFILPCKKKLEALDRAFLGLESAKSAERYVKTRQYYEELKIKALESYPELHRKLFEVPTTNLQVVVGSNQERTKLCVQLTELSRTAKAIVSVADNLIFDLIDLITRDGR